MSTDADDDGARRAWLARALLHFLEAIASDQLIPFRVAGR